MTSYFNPSGCHLSLPAFRFEINAPLGGARTARPRIATTGIQHADEPSALQSFHRRESGYIRVFQNERLALGHRDGDIFQLDALRIADLEAFRGVIKTWEDFAVFGFLIDRVGRYQLEEFLDCSYLPLQRILPEILKEEIGHIGFGTNQTAELAAKGDEERERVQRSVDFWYIKALDMFGRSDSERSNRFCHWGLKRRSNSQARWEFIKEVGPIIQGMGLTVPDPIKDRKFL